MKSKIVGAVFATLVFCCTSAVSMASSDSGWALDAVIAVSNALNDIERVYPDGGDAVINGISALGKAHMDALEYAEAEQDYTRALANSSTRAVDALPLLRKAAKIRRVAFGVNHPLSKLAEENIKKLQREIDKANER